MKLYIRKLIFIVSVVLMLIVLGFITVRKIQYRKTRMVENSERIFWQIESIMNQNLIEFNKAAEEISIECKTKARTAAIMLKDIDIKEFTSENLRIIAELIDIDEIHLFDEKGALFASSDARYIGLTFDSGSQIEFFKPLLDNRDLYLCQDITPNTADGKLMQYAALWSEYQDIIIQIGYEPRRFIDLTEKNQLSFVFSLLMDSDRSSIYAIDKDSGVILGATEKKYEGSRFEEIHLTEKDFLQLHKVFKVSAPDIISSYCVIHESSSVYYVRFISSYELFEGINVELSILIVCLILVFLVFNFIVEFFLDKKIVYAIDEINGNLREITEGNLNITVDTKTTPEFAKLSEYINSMVFKLNKDLTEDQLTSLFTRRAFYNELETIFSENTVPYVAVFMIDADNLKSVNDKFGHETGDSYLKRISELLTELPVEKKMVSRLGGDEFAVIVYGNEDTDFNLYLEQYRHLRSGSRMHISSQFDIEISFSVGMAKSYADGDNYHVLLKKADARMYQDKMSRKKSR